MIRKFTHSPYRFILLALLVGLIIFVLRINQVDGGLGASVVWLFIDGLICLLGFFFWLFFFSQFVLPVRSFEDRLRVYQHLWLFIRGRHGPAFFIENGVANPPRGEFKREGPGVILLDTASAAVLRTDQKFTRAVGPGLVFTEHNEYLESNKAVVDLRLQKQTIGPSLDQEGQLAALKSADPARIAALNRERMETRALTRDGIEIIPKISVYFKLDAPPGVGNSEFGYNWAAVEKAIIGRNIDANLPPDTPDRIRDWRWIPAYLAADVWKESLSKYTLEELFRSPPGQPTALQQIMDAVQNRLTLENVPALGDYGQPTGQTSLSQEYQLLLNRGIKVTRVEIFDLQMPESVEKLLLERWKSTWLNQARKESDFIQSNRSYIEKEVTEEAADAYILQTASLLGAVPEGEVLNCAQTLSLLLQGSRQVIVQNPQMNKTMRWEMEQLQELIDWADARGSE